jgi:polysaccharide chain length determinant protein (PEP-CTERM system associated)
MQDLLQQFLDHLRGLWRFRYWALLATWIACLVGWLVVLALPPVYQASARVYVDTSAVLKPLLEGIAVDQDVNSQLNFVQQALLSRPQLETVIREADLDLKAATPLQHEKLLKKVRDNITIEAVSQGKREGKGDSLFTINYQASNRNQALKVVQTMVNSFVDDSLGGKRAGSETAQRFLQAQIQDYEKRLAGAEAALADFKKSNIGLVPGAQGDYFTRLQNETDAIDKAQSSLRVAVERRAALDRQLKGEQPMLASAGRSASNSGGPTGASADLNGRIAETQARLDDLLLKYTDKHPDVIAMRETLQQLKVRRSAEIEAFKHGTASPETMAGLGANPVYQQLQLQINEVEVEIASLRSELGVHQQRVAELRGMLDTAPEVEAQYSRLTRDYDVTKAQYNELVNRLDRARISDQAEQTGVVKFEVIDPPTVLLEPVAPNRPRLLTAILFVGLAVGLGLAFLLNQMRPVFDNTRSLKDVTGLPVLGAVSRTWRDRYLAERRTELQYMTAATACLLAVFILMLLVYRPAANVLQSMLGA